jgi:hypothetical protein
MSLHAKKLQSEGTRNQNLFYRGGGLSASCSDLFTSGKVIRYSFQGRSLIGGVGQTSSGKSCPKGLRTMDHPARNESLYRLSYSEFSIT